MSPQAPATASAFAYRLSHPVAPLPQAVFETVTPPDAVPYAFDAADTSEHPPPALTFALRLSAAGDMSRTATCAAIVSVARGHDLPVAFFANLIWQESNFNPRDISRAGAQGIAQFMPETAVEFGLINPFEPIHALNVAARFLTELHARFGNLGLAAAAYNAGPGRITNWLTKGASLPSETRNYVLRITGKPATSWTSASIKSDPEATLMPAKAPCPEVAEAVREQAQAVRVAKLMQTLARSNDAASPANAEAKASDRDHRKSIQLAMRERGADEDKPRGARRNGARHSGGARHAWHKRLARQRWDIGDDRWSRPRHARRDRDEPKHKSWKLSRDIWTRHARQTRVAWR